MNPGPAFRPGVASTTVPKIKLSPRRMAWGVALTINFAEFGAWYPLSVTSLRTGGSSPKGEPWYGAPLGERPGTEPQGNGCTGNRHELGPGPPRTPSLVTFLAEQESDALRPYFAGSTAG